MTQTSYPISHYNFFLKAKKEHGEALPDLQSACLDLRYLDQIGHYNLRDAARNVNH